MDTRTTEKRARARAAKLIRAIALSTIMAATVILPLAVLAETPSGGGLDSLGISATEAAIGVNGDTQASDLGLNQQNPENGGNGGLLQGDAGVEAEDAGSTDTGAPDSEPKITEPGEPEAPVNDEPEVPADDVPEAPVDGEPEAPADNEPEAPADGESEAQADQAQSESADSNPIDNKPVKAMANGINALAADGVYTVGAGADMDYKTPADAIVDNKGLRDNDNAPWVMELHENVTLTGTQISIPAGMALTIRSAAGEHYTIDANKKSRVILAEGDNISLTLADVKITGGYTSNFQGGAGVRVYGTGCSFTMKAGSEVSGNTPGDGCGAVYVQGIETSFTMKAGSKISDNTSTSYGGGAYVNIWGEKGIFTMEGGSEISDNKTATSDYRGGGGVYILDGIFTMKAGSKISGNTAGGNGGGVYASISVTFIMEAGSKISGNISGGNGGGVYLCTFTSPSSNPRKSSFTMKGGEISNNTAVTGGGVYAVSSENSVYTEDYRFLSIPEGAEVAFSGNKASGDPYLLSDADRVTPPATFEGAITSLSVKDINEANGFEVSTPELVAAANKKSVFNNYDIGYTAGMPFTNIYTVGTGVGYDYTTPKDALKDTGGVRDADELALGEFWVMELHNDFILNDQLSITEGMNLMVRSARGRHYIIDAKKQSRVIYADGEGISLTLADITLTGGAVDRGGGGGVYVSGGGSSLTMGAGSVVSHNTSGGSGGGVRVSNASLTMEAGSEVSHNEANGNNDTGGGVYVSGANSSFIMEAGSVISHNYATSYGGGVDVSSGAPFIMKGGEISHNRNQSGGGGVRIYGDGSSFTMEAGSVISDNSTGTYGGGVYLSGTDSGPSFTMEAGSTITGNTAERGDMTNHGGGGVCVHNGSLTLKGGEITNNTARQNGGGVYLYSGLLSIPEGAQVAFSGNKTSRTPYALSEAHKTTPPQTIEGDITSLSVEEINEANGFDVSTPELLATANRKSVFNNNDIGYLAGVSANGDIPLDVLTLSYLDEKGGPISEAETLLYQGKKPYPLAGSPKQGMGWSLTEADDGLVVSAAGITVGEDDLLAPASGLSFNLTVQVPSHRVSAKFALAPYTYTVRFLDYDGTALSAQRVNYGAAATPPASPTRAGYSFTGWSAGFDGITADTDITALYEALTTPPPTPIAPWPTPPAPIAPVAPEPKPESKPESTPGSTTASTEGSGTETPTAKTPATSATPPSPPANPSTDPGAETPAADDPATDETTGPNAATAAETGTNPEAGADNAGNAAENGQGTGDAEAKSAGSPLALLSGNGEIVSQDELRELARKADVPLVGIGDSAIPLIGIDGYSFWSLADLAIILFAAAIAAWNILAYRRRRGQGGLAAATEPGGNARPLPIAILVVTIANAALFLLSQDFAAAPLVLVDIWTILEAALFIAECMLVRVASNRAIIMYGDSEEIGNPVDVRSA